MLEQVSRGKEGEHEEGRGLLLGPGQGVRVKHGGLGTGQERPDSACMGPAFSQVGGQPLRRWTQFSSQVGVLLVGWNQACEHLGTSAGQRE